MSTLLWKIRNSFVDPRFSNIDPEPLSPTLISTLSPEACALSSPDSAALIPTEVADSMNIHNSLSQPVLTPTRSGLRAALLVVSVVALGAIPLSAHHGLAAFDTTRTVKMEGTVTNIEWINPHAFIYADLKDDTGKVANWKLELGSLGMLTKYGGWTESTAKRGDHVIVQGFRAKDGSPYMSLGRIWLPDGRSLEGKP
jgi:hypothetical protein